MRNPALSFIALAFLTTSAAAQAQQSQSGIANTDMENTKHEGLSMSPSGTTMNNGADRAPTYYPQGHEPGSSSSSSGNR